MASEWDNRYSNALREVERIQVHCQIQVSFLYPCWCCSQLAAIESTLLCVLATQDTWMCHKSPTLPWEPQLCQTSHKRHLVPGDMWGPESLSVPPCPLLWAWHYRRSDRAIWLLTFFEQSSIYILSFSWKFSLSPLEIIILSFQIIKVKHLLWKM